MGDHQVAALLRAAGRRPQAPEEVAARVRASAHAEWLRSLRARRLRAWSWTLGSLAAAAALVVAVGSIEKVPSGSEAPAVVAPVPAATIEVLSGALSRSAGERATSESLAVGDVVEVGGTLSSGEEGRAALRLTNGSSLRLGRGTVVRFESPYLLALERGRLYVDSGRSRGEASAATRVRTPVGMVEEIGTQFEVRSDPSATRIRVREGAVVLERAGESVEAKAGGELTLTLDGDLSRRAIAVHGDEWGWVLELAPSIRLEGRTLGSFLDWVGRETGWEVRFEPQALEDEASGIVLHGSIEGLRPDQALEAVLPTCGLAHRVRGGAVVVAAGDAL